MEKTLYLIGGPMGVGKTTLCRILQKRLPRAVFLDGDWCWDADPFQVTEETKAVALDNICHVLNNFLACSAYENVIFCWVLHEQSILDNILSRLDRDHCRVLPVSLICEEAALTARLEKDIAAGIRDRSILARSLERLGRYAELDTLKVDVSALTPEETADAVLAL